MPTIIDKRCGEIGNWFLGVVRDTQVLDYLPRLPHGSHDLLMTSLMVNAEAGRDLLNRPQYTYNLGTALALMDTSLTLAAKPLFFPELQLREDDITHFRDVGIASFASYEYLKATTPTELKRFTPHEMPDNEVRIGLANQLFDISARFVALHEQGHFVRGHLHHLFSVSGTLRFRELPPFGEAPERDPGIGRAFELDADAFAGAVMFGDILGFPAIFDAEQMGLGELRGTDDFARLALTSVACVLAILARSDEALGPSGRDAKERDHPSAACRLLNIWDVFVQACRRLFGRELSDDDPFFARCLDDVNTVLGMLQGPLLDPRHVRAIMRGEALDRSDPIVSELLADRETQGQLSPYLSAFADQWLGDI